MSYHQNPEEKESEQSSEEIRVPPISKQTAGAVTGAAIGSVAGPIGAVVGGVVGAIAGKAAARGRSVGKAARDATAVSKSSLKRHSVKESPPKSVKAGGRQSRAKTAKRTESRRSVAGSHKRTVRAPRKLKGPRRGTPSSRARQKGRSGRTKRR